MGGKRKTVPAPWLPVDMVPESHLQHLLTEKEPRWKEAVQGCLGGVGVSGAEQGNKGKAPERLC